MAELYRTLNEAYKCYVYDSHRCNGTWCDECVDGEYCEPCQRGYDSDHEDHYDILAEEGETPPKGDVCFGSRSCRQRR